MQAVAVVGTANTGPDVAAPLRGTYPNATMVIAFDNDRAGARSAPTSASSATASSPPPPRATTTTATTGGEPTRGARQPPGRHRPSLYQPGASVRTPVAEL